MKTKKESLFLKSAQLFIKPLLKKLVQNYNYLNNLTIYHMINFQEVLKKYYNL
jgi:hypothetical protein